jgi:hypothetical protein
VVVGFFLALFMFVFLALLLEGWERRKMRMTPGV